MDRWTPCSCCIVWFLSDRMDPEMQIGVPSIDGLSLSDVFVSLRTLGECLTTQAFVFRDCTYLSLSRSLPFIVVLIILLSRLFRQSRDLFCLGVCQTFSNNCLDLRLVCQRCIGISPVLTLAITAWICG